MKKKNNKGFSLIELLVAIAILAVIITPFLFAFLTTTSINSKTKAQQSAKYAGTNVMEDIRSRKVQDVLDDSNTTKQDDGTYIYTTTQSVDGKDYTVEAVLDPRYDAASKDDQSTDYNAEKMAKLYGMNSAYDCLHEIDASEDAAKIEQLAEIKFGSRDTENIQKVYDATTREIVVKIKATEKGGTQVFVQSIYKDLSSAQAHTVATMEQNIYSNDQVDLRGVYIFFNPLYNGKKGVPKETITVINEKGNDCTVYLCKQDWKLDTAKEKEDFPLWPFLSDIVKNRSEKGRNDEYCMNIRLSEPGRSDGELISDGKILPVTVIRTNVDDDLSKYEHVSSANVPNKKLELFYSNTPTGYELTKTVYGIFGAASDFMNLKGLGGESVEDRVYKVNVKVYNGVGDDRESESIITLQSTTQ